MAEAFADDVCGGYTADVGTLLRKNSIQAPAGKTEVVSLRDITVTTMCPHHLMPATGFATVAFAPRGLVLGFGTLADLVDAFAHRLTLQETIGDEVVAALMTHLEPVWAGCRLVLTHTCVTGRGGRRHGARAETVALAGSPNGEDHATAMAVLGVGR